ncbi:MAG: 16S rRNA (guanine(527)-N(7))-methyltransferase RsmG [Solirubrobacteraceae bacterium]
MSASIRLDELAAQWAISATGVAALENLLIALARDDAPTRIREPDRAVNAHVADALTGLGVEELATARRVADIGAGAGVPGLVLAAARAQMEVTEVESAGRKCAFMAELIGQMGLANARVACTRVEAWAQGHGACDAVTVRAVAPLPVIVEYGAPLLADGGVLVAWKGAPDAAEVADGDHAAQILGLTAARRVSVPPFPGADQRTLYVYLKVGSLPNGYPRRPGIARKRPLRAST